MRNRKLIVFCLTLLLIVLLLNPWLSDANIFEESQAENENEQYIHEVLWNQTYGGANYDSANALVQTADGGFALAGSTASFGAGSHDFWLVKTTADGAALWNQTYGGTGGETANALIQTIDDGFALAGYTESYGAGIFDMWLAKTTPSGTTEWNWTYGGTAEDYTAALVQTAESSFVLAGSTKSYGAGESDMILVKIITSKITTTTTTTDTTGNGTPGMEIFPLLIAIVILTLWNKCKKKFSFHRD